LATSQELPSPSSGYRRRRLTRQRLEWLGAAENLAVQDGVPGIGVRGPATPSLGDLAQRLLYREAFGDGLARAKAKDWLQGPSALSAGA